MPYQSVGIVGMAESGKSYELAKLARKCPRICVFDPTGDDDNFDWVPNIVWDLGALDGFLAQVYGQKTWAVRYIPYGESDDDLKEEFAEVSSAILEQGDCCFAVDELSQVAQYNQMPGAFSKIVRQGRHWGVNLLWTSQRAAEVPLSVRAQVRQWFLFCQRDPADLKAVGERCGAEVEDRVSRLGLRELVAFDMITGKMIPEEEAVRQFAQAVKTQPVRFIKAEEEKGEGKEEEEEQPPVPWWERRFIVFRRGD